MLCQTVMILVDKMRVANRLFLSLLLAGVVPGIAVAGGGVKINNLVSSWKNPIMSHCMTSNLGNATIGRYRETCKGNYSIDANSPSACVLGDDMGILVMVAREVNENGARFCPTTIYAEKKKRGNAWTLYSEPAQGVQPCYWLCKAGYGGEGCQSTDISGCDSVPLRRDDFNSLTMARDPQFEDSIPMFHWNQYKGCGVNKGQEHDMILMISDWLPSGHGAYAAPFVIRARREGYKSKRGGIDAWPAGESTLLCKNGYTVNAAGNDCEPVDANTCALTNICDGWSSSAFDETTMLMEYDDSVGRSCYTYRCREAGYAFPSIGDKTCQPCTTSLRGGVSPADGTCVACELGQIFDETASASGYCVPADAYTRTDMQYGVNQTKDSAPLDDQCWMMFEPDEYSACVRGQEYVPTSSDESSLSSD